MENGEVVLAAISGTAKWSLLLTSGRQAGV